MADRSNHIDMTMRRATRSDAMSDAMRGAECMRAQRRRNNAELLYDLVWRVQEGAAELALPQIRLWISTDPARERNTHTYAHTGLLDKKIASELQPPGLVESKRIAHWTAVPPGVRRRLRTGILCGEE